MSLIISKSKKEVQQREVRRHLYTLARRGELTTEGIEEVLRAYDETAFTHGKKYLRRLLRLWRGEVLTVKDVLENRWAKVEARGNAWYDDDGQQVPREVHAEEAAAKKKQKSARPPCAAINADGQPCGAKAYSGGALCWRHSQLAARKCYNAPQ